MTMIDYCDLVIVGSLLFKEYPSTIVYSYKNNRPYIVEWIDVSDSGVDKFFLYEVSKGNLKEYIDRKISHHELIQLALNGIAVFFEDKIGCPENILITDVKLIEEGYLPLFESYFDKNDSADLEKIILHFELDKILI